MEERVFVHSFGSLAYLKEGGEWRKSDRRLDIFCRCFHWERATVDEHGHHKESFYNMLNSF